jgi:hypothetical protein
VSSVAVNNGISPINLQGQLPAADVSPTPLSSSFQSVGDAVAHYRREWQLAGGDQIDEWQSDDGEQIHTGRAAKRLSAETFIKSRFKKNHNADFKDNCFAGMIAFSAHWEKYYPEHQELPGFSDDLSNSGPDLSVYRNVKLKTMNTELGWIPSRAIDLEIFTGRKDWAIPKGTGTYTMKASSAMTKRHLDVVASVIRHWQKYGAPVKISSNGELWESSVSAFLGTIARDCQGSRKEGRTSKPSGAELNSIRKIIQDVIDWECVMTYAGADGEQVREERISFFENIEFTRTSKSKNNQGQGIGRFELKLSGWLIKQFDSTRVLKPFYWSEMKRDKNCEALRTDMNLAKKVVVHDKASTRAKAANYPVPKTDQKVARLAPATKQVAMAKRDAMRMQGRRLTDAFTHPEEHLQESARCFAWWRHVSEHVSVFARVTEKQWSILEMLGLTDGLHNQMAVLASLNNFLNVGVQRIFTRDPEKQIMNLLKHIEQEIPWTDSPPL